MNETVTPASETPVSETPPTEQRIEVTAPPAESNGVGETTIMSGAPVINAGEGVAPEAETPDTPETPTEDTEPSPDAAELEKIAQRADELRIQAPEGASTQQQGTATQQPEEITTDQKIDYLVNTIHLMQERMNNPQQQQSQPQAASPSPGVDDIYGGVFNSDPPPQEDPNYVTREQFDTLKQELEQAQGVIQGLYTGQTSIHQRFEEEARQSAESQKITEIQNESNLTRPDAVRVHDLLKAGEIGAAFKYAQGKSMTDEAFAAHHTQRAHDRSLAGRPALSGNATAAPAAEGALIEQKYKEMAKMPDGPEKDDAIMWLVQNGGMDHIKQQAQNIPAQTFKPIPVGPGIEESGVPESAATGLPLI